MLPRNNEEGLVLLTPWATLIPELGKEFVCFFFPCPWFFCGAGPWLTISSSASLNSQDLFYPHKYTLILSMFHFK